MFPNLLSEATLLATDVNKVMDRNRSRSREGVYDGNKEQQLVVINYYDKQTISQNFSNNQIIKQSFILTATKRSVTQSSIF